MTFWTESAGYDPYRNLAIEEQLMDLCDGGPILYLWQNQRTVVIGRNQDPARECRAALLEAEGGHLARRLSGGGAVYHDLGNLNFSFLARREDYDVPKQLGVICRAMESLGLSAVPSGRNDLEIEGRKFSGNAFYERNGWRCHHGTIMVDVDRETLDRYLTVPEKKLASRGIASVQARVVDLRELRPNVTVKEVKAALLAAFERIFGEEPRQMDISMLDGDALKAGEDRFRDRAWIYGKQHGTQEDTDGV